MYYDNFSLNFVLEVGQYKGNQMKTSGCLIILMIFPEIDDRIPFCPHFEASLRARVKTDKKLGKMVKKSTK